MAINLRSAAMLPEYSPDKISNKGATHPKGCGLPLEGVFFSVL